jgi:cytochrome c oxidase assembly protein subunit 15
MWPQSAFVMAVHFGISLICFASVFLLTRLLYQTSPDAAAARPLATLLPGWYRAATWGALIAAIGVAYIGAYMRHSDAVLACYRWPSCDDQGVFPGFDGAAGVAFGHRLAALGEILLVGALAAVTYRRRAAEPELFRINAAAFVLILLQAATGGAVVLTGMDLWSPLAHAGLMALLFLCLADACRQLGTRRQAEGGRRKAEGARSVSQIARPAVQPET